MALIRVAIIGLSSQTGEISASPGDGWAASAHLPYLQASSKFEITALCNSSEKSARAAIEKYKLPPSTKAYGSPEDLAKDPDVDLVVCNVRVDRHHKVMMPILAAGKDSYVEWPLGSNLQQAEEMLAAAKKSCSKTIVGLQARNSPVTVKIKQLVEAKKIGNLLSSEMQVYTGYLGGDTEPPGIDYLSRREVGGNLFTIPFAHIADPAFFAMGGVKEVSAILPTRIKQTRLLHADGSFDKMMERTAPDQVILQSIVKTADAPFVAYLRGGKQFKDSPPVVWQLYGTKGQIRLTAQAPISLGLGNEKIEVYNIEGDSVENIEWAYTDDVKDLPPLAKNIARLYELYATGQDLDQGYVRFEEAVGMHKVLAAMEQSDSEKRWIQVEA